MSQENIWKQSLEEESVDVSSKRIIIKDNLVHELTELELRNYFNEHKLKEISLDSIYDYFKDNMFKNYEGLYLPHLLCAVPYTGYDKIYKALEEVFLVISPNRGSLTDENYNFFQYFMLVWRRNNIFEEFDSKFLELYELGIKHGLNTSYLDLRYCTNGYYYMLSAPLEDIEKNYLRFLELENLKQYWLKTIINAFQYRRYDSSYFSDLFIFNDIVEFTGKEKNILKKKLMASNFTEREVCCYYGKYKKTYKVG